MKCTKTLTLEAFKDTVAKDKDFARKLVGGKSDTIDFDNGSMIIHRENINKYLEQYLCKSEEDLQDTLWFSYGVFVKIID